MALNWNIKNVLQKDSLFHDNNELKGVYEQIIWLTMDVGISKITEKNYKQFFKRTELMQRIKGPLLTYYDHDKDVLDPYYITENNIKNMIGMHTNASTKTALQFLKQFKDEF